MHMHVCFAGAMCLLKELPHLAIRYLNIFDELKKKSFCL